MGVAHTDNPTGLYAEVELSRVHIVDKRVGYADIQVDLAGVIDVGKLERYEAEVLVGLGVNDAYVGAAVVRSGCLHGKGHGQ